MSFLLLLFCWFVAGQMRVGAASSPETKAFNAAAYFFRSAAYEKAEVELGQFVEIFTNSPLVAEAILYRAEARIKLTNYDGAITLLAARREGAGKWTDEYLFWQAEAQLDKGEYRAAAELFAKLAAEYPQSARCLEAIVEEASARAMLIDWQRVVELLQRTNGVFQAAVRTNAANELAARGCILLSEGELARQDYEAAQAAIEPLAEVPLKPKMDWQREYLLCRILAGKGQSMAALAEATNLLALAADTGQRSLQADSVAFEASLLERLGRATEAIAAYTNNVTEGVPVERQRQAILRITELSLKQDRVPEALQWLDKFVSEHPAASSMDLALLTLGELRLRHYAADSNTNSPPLTGFPSPPPTNSIDKVEEPLLTLTTKFGQSPLVGKAQLDLGWCYWLQTNLPQCQQAFTAAIDHLRDPLPVSADLAIAYFKLGDAQFEQTNYAGALTNYQAVVALHEKQAVFAPADWEMLETNLLERALYQAVRAGLMASNFTAASHALVELLDWYPNGFHTGRATLLAGQEFNRKGNPGEARQIFQAFRSRAPESALLPEVELAVARTYERERKGDEAIGQYDEWLAVHTNHVERPAAEFYRALANSQAGRQTNALRLMTNLVTEFPTNEWTPQAQWWIAAYYYNTGNFLEAEKNYQLLSRSTNGATDLPYLAQMMAGRAAAQRQDWKDATNYFTNLCLDAKCPQDLHYQAMFAYGDILMSLDSRGADKEANLQTAIDLFGVISDSTNRLAPLAWGEKALCYFQWPQYAQTTNAFPKATNAFQKVIDATNSPSASVTARTIARVGLAVVLKKQAELANGVQKTNLLKQALSQYQEILAQTDLQEKERPDAIYWSWVEKAGLDAGPLAEELQDWPQASGIYERLQELLPSLRATLEEKRIRAEKNELGASR